MVLFFVLDDDDYDDDAVVVECNTVRIFARVGSPRVNARSLEQRVLSECEHGEFAM